MPSWIRKHQQVAMISQAFIDETGESGDKTLFIMAGYIAHKETWETFSDDWQEELDKQPQLPPIHMTHFERMEEGFEVLGTEAEKNKRLSALVGIIRRYKPRPFCVVAHMDTYRACIRGQKVRPAVFGHHYYMSAAHLVPAALTLHEKDRHDYGLVHMIFDYHEKYGPRLKEHLKTKFRPFLLREHPKYAARLGEVDWPDPDLKHNYVALQAADVLAWHQQRAIEFPHEKRRAMRELQADRLIRVFPLKAELIHRYLERVGAQPSK
jgi:hypothetical protein